MRRIHALSVLATWTAWTLAMAGGGPTRAAPLERELERLIAGHPEIGAREKAVDSARRAFDRAYAGFLPRLDMSYEVGPQHIDSPVARRAGGGAWDATKEAAGLRLTQTLFDGFFTPSQVKTARLGIEVADFTLAGIRQNVLFQGISAYIEVLRQKRLVGLSRSSERTIMTQLHLENERVQRGAGIGVDVLQAKSRLQIAKERRVAYEGALEDATARYIQVFNHPPDLTAMPEPAPAEGLLPRDLDEAMVVAEQENPAIDGSLATVEAASERRRLTRAGHYPTLNVVGAANYEKNNDLVLGTRVDYSVVLQATWNLFNGFATDAGVAQATVE